ncbi:MAG: YjgP/YjgQ family permease [Rhizobiales bacterium]|nr:YjgP/YjgQ family permease [Hyphomicrobiales bacterium]
MLFNTLDRYVMRTVAKPLGAAMAVGLLMLLAERLVRVLDATLGKKNSFGVVIEILAYLVPHYLGTAIPAALFLGLLFGFSRLSKDSEVDAAMSAGVGLHRLTLPVMQISLLLSVVSVLIFGWAQPHARYAYRSVVFDLKNIEVFYLAEEGVFMQAGSRTFILDELERGRSAFQRVFVYDYRGKAGAETVTATDGILIPQDGGKRPVLRLENVHRLKIEGLPDPTSAAPPPGFEIAQSSVLDTPLGKVAGDVFRPRGEDERELTLPELYANLDTPPQGSSPAAMRSEFNKRLANVATLFVLPLLAVPFAVGSRRSRRAYSFAIALAILVAFHEAIEQGSVAVKSGALSSFVAIWLPFLLLTAFAIWRFWNACFGLKRDRLQDLAERLGDFFQRLFRKFITANGDPA